MNRYLLTAVAVIVAALFLPAVASAAIPQNTSPPTISGTPATRVASSQGGPSLLGLCKSYLGPSMAALACDPVALRAAVKSPILKKKSTFSIAVRGRRVGSQAGLSGAIGRPLGPGEGVALRGRITKSLVLTLHIRTKNKSWQMTVTRLDRLVTSRSATSKAAIIKLRVYLLKGRPAVSLVPSGKRVTSVSLRTVNY